MKETETMQAVHGRGEAEQGAPIRVKVAVATRSPAKLGKVWCAQAATLGSAAASSEARWA